MTEQSARETLTGLLTAEIDKLAALLGAADTAEVVARGVADAWESDDAAEVVRHYSHARGAIHSAALRFEAAAAIVDKLQRFQLDLASAKAP